MESIKVSEYCTAYQVEDVYYRYNSLKNTFIEIRLAELNALFDYPEKMQEFDGRLYDLLVRNGMYIPAEANERDELLARYKAARSNPYIGNVTLITDLRCNLQCPYCFQHRTENATLSPDSEGKILEFCQTMLTVQPIKALVVRYYGGEPLMNIASLLRLQKNLWAFCRGERDIMLKTLVFTNGTLLDSDTLKALEEHQISGINMSIDKYRIGKKQVFEKLIEVFQNTANLTSTRASLRVNVDEDYRMVVDTLAPIIKKHDLKRKLNISVEPIFGYNAHTVDMKNLRYKFAAMEYFLRKYDLSLVDFPQRKEVGCHTAMRNSVILDPSLNVYKCHQDIGNSDLSIGNIVNNQLPNSQIEDKLEKWRCIECKFLPICMGECQSIRSADFIAQGCKYNSDILEMYFKLLYEMRHRMMRKNNSRLTEYTIGNFNATGKINSEIA